MFLSWFANFSKSVIVVYFYPFHLLSRNRAGFLQHNTDKFRYFSSTTRPWNGKEIFVHLQKQPQLFLKNDNDIMERFRIVHGDMFSKYDSESLSRSRDKQVSDAIARLSDDYVLNVNEVDYIKYLIDGKPALA